MSKNIYDKIALLRKEKGISQEYMAEQLGIEQSTYGKIERGAIKLTIEKLELISQVFQLSIIDIIVYPEKFVNVKDFGLNGSQDSLEATLQIKLGKDKKDQVLRLVFGENNLEILNR